MTSEGGEVMTVAGSTAQLDERFSSPGATAVPWSEARDHLREAEIYWLSTVHRDGRPNVAPLIAVWLEETLYFCTGDHERKAKNIARNPSVAVTTGCNLLGEGMDVVMEGDAVMVRDEALLQRIADAYVTKYGSDWKFGVRDEAFYADRGSLREVDTSRVLVFAVDPSTAFGFGRGELFSQTRWGFEAEAPEQA
jgi:nitroimidazol reductase NimA-like FMN-containing flavoprotein (pyridoxamine 5'-phosphate oxidase superfamily)